MSRDKEPAALEQQAAIRLSPPRDTLYRDEAVTTDFQFTDRVAEVFEDMLDRSIPCYRMVIEMTGRVLAEFLSPGDQVLDLGCSIGTTLLALARQLDGCGFQYIGIDNAPAMIDKARLKAEMYSRAGSVSFREGDILEADFSGAGAILCNYTLQFIRPLERSRFLSRVHAALRPGGIFILSEKIISHDPLFNRSYTNFYFDFKRAQGYSEIEISRKREALENVLLPFSLEENRRLLAEAGFGASETFFQWFNFASFVARK